MLIELKNKTTGETVTLTMLTPKFDDIKKEEAFHEAMERAVDVCLANMGKASYMKTQGDEKGYRQAQADYAIGFITLVSLAHSCSDKGIAATSNEKEFKENVRTIEEGLIKLYESTFDKAERKNGASA